MKPKTTTKPMPQAQSAKAACAKSLHKHKTLFLAMLFALFSYMGFGQALSGTINSDCGTTICRGGTAVVNIQPTGGVAPYSIIWNTIPAQTGNFITLSPFTNPSTNTLGGSSVTCTIIDNAGTTITVPFNYIITTPTLPRPNVNLSATSICPYDTVNVKPNGANVISASVFCVNPSYSNLCQVVPASFPANYTVTLQNPTGCQTDVSFTINSSAIACRGNRFSITLPTTLNNLIAIPGREYVINQDMTISGTVSFSNNNILIAPGVKITVLPGATLNLNGCYLHACDCMWYGIEVDGNGIVNVSNATVIEDAIYAISTDNVSSTSVPTINVANTLFNKNNVGILIRQKISNLNSSITIYNTNIFTGRSIPETGFGAIYNNLANFNALFTDFQVNWHTIGSSYPPANTNYGDRSNVGILVSGYSNISPIVIGDNLGGISVSNIFDAINYGVLSIASNVNISFNQFQNMPGNSAYNPITSVTHLTANGVGVYAGVDINTYSGSTVVAADMTNSILVSENNFYNTFRGVDIYDYLDINVNSNKVYNTKNNPQHLFATTGNWLGQYGVQVTYPQVKGKTTPLPTCLLNVNSIYNTATGIHIMRNYYNANQITVECNQIGDPTIVSDTTGTTPTYIFKGISVEDVTGSLSSTIPAHGITITGNSVYNAMQSCIYASNVKKGLYIFSNGTLVGVTAIGGLATAPALCLNSTVVSAPTYVASVQTENCQGGFINCNQGIFYIALSATIPVNKRLTGILVENSPGMEVTGNIVQNMRNGVVFKGGSPAATFNNCRIKYTHFAYVLDACAIGTQGGTTTTNPPVHFDWISNNTFTTANISSADPNFNSKMFLNPVCVPPPGKNFGSVPTGPGCPFPVNTKYTSFYPPSPLCIGLNGFGANLNTYSGCPSPPPVVCGGGGAGILPPLAAKLSAQQMLEILADSLAADSLAQNRQWHNHRFLWERILMDTLYPTAPAAVQAFYTANQSMGMGMLAKTDVALAQMNTAAALSLNSFAPANMYEAKQQQVNGVKIKLADTTGAMTVTAADISLLKNIANGCPDSYGKAFYEARSILNLLHGQELQYTSHCADGNSYRLDETEGTEQITDNVNQLSIYPNPNAGEFTINYTGSGKQLSIEIYNTLGALVISKQYTIENSKVINEISNLGEGVYMLRFMVDGTVVRTSRVIVTK